MSLEDYTTYEEVDPHSHIVVASATHIDFDSYEQENAYVYKDMGVDYFGSYLEHFVKARLVSSTTLWRHSNSWLVSNTIGGTMEIENASGDYLRVWHYYGDGTFERIGIMECNAGVLQWDFYAVPVMGAYYYMTIIKNGTAFTCRIYSDAERTTLLDTLTLTIADKSYRYIYACNVQGFPDVDGPDHVTLDIENLSLGIDSAEPPWVDRVDSGVLTTNYSQINEGASVSPARAKRGMYSIKILTEIGQAGTGSWVARSLNLATYTTLYLSAYVYLENLPLAGTTFENMLVLRGGGTDMCAMQIERQAAGTLRWGIKYRKAGALVEDWSGTLTPATGQWYFCEIKCVMDAVNGEVSLWVDETLEVSDDTFDNATGEPEMDAVQIGIVDIPTDEDKTVHFDVIRIDTSYIDPETARTDVRATGARHGSI